MLWMLLVYVVASNGYASAPTITPSFHGATFTTSEECNAAARKVSLYSTPGTDDIAKSGMILVCSPAQADPPPPAPPAPIVVQVPQSMPPTYPSFPPPPPLKPPHH